LRRLLLRDRGVDGIPVISRFDFREQLSPTHVLAFFDQYAGYPAAHQESDIGGFRTFD
jgi:hypothetical protein